MKADDTLKITLFDMLKHETFISFEYARLSKKMNELNFKEKNISNLFFVSRIILER